MKLILNIICIIFLNTISFYSLIAQKCTIEQRIFIYDSNADSVRQAFLNCDTIICSSISFRLTKSTEFPIFPNVKYIVGQVGSNFRFYESNDFFDFPKLEYCRQIDLLGASNRNDTTKVYVTRIKAFPLLREVDTLGFFFGNQFSHPKNIMESMEGFNSLKKVNKIFGFDYFGKKLNGFYNLEEIGEYCEISDSWLENLDEFSNLRKIGKSFGSINPSNLIIERNPLLSEIGGLRNVVLTPNAFGKLSIRGNESLSTCNIQSVCDVIAVNKQQVLISNNGLGCESVPTVKQQCITSIDEVQGTSIYVYPNPTNGIITVEGILTNAKISILNINGILQHKIQIIDNQINLENLQNGLYFIKIETKNNIETQKVLKIDN